MRITLLPVILVVLCTLSAAGDETNPIRYTWIATSCETWNTAAAALVVADGGKDVIVLPTGVEERPWLILRRVEEGSLYIPDDEPFLCETHDTVSLATDSFHAMSSCRHPLILNVPDGRAVVVALRTCDEGRRRAVR